MIFAELKVFVLTFQGKLPKSVNLFQGKSVLFKTEKINPRYL